MATIISSPDRKYNPKPIFCGSKWLLTVTMKNKDGTLIDLTGYTFYCQIYTEPGGTLLADTTVDVDLTTSVVSISLTPEETVAIGATSGDYSLLQVKDDDEDDVQTILWGTIPIYPQITIVPEEEPAP